MPTQSESGPPVYAPAVLRPAALVCLLLSPALACAPASGEGEETGTTGETGASGEWASLIDHEQWQVLDAAADPLADHRPELVECGLAGWYLETAKLEVDTNFCNYLAVAQPSLVALEQGQTVQVIFYHFDLVAPEPALAHVSILVDGEVLWEQEITIPGDANVFLEEFPSPITAELGSEVVFHLHNHGQNTWVLQDLMAMR
jgi:hypothetical protein